MIRLTGSSRLFHAASAHIASRTDEAGRFRVIAAVLQIMGYIRTTSRVWAPLMLHPFCAGGRPTRVFPQWADTNSRIY